VIRPRDALRALLPFAFHALARDVDAAVGVLLHTTLDLPGFVGQALSLLDPGRTALRVILWVLAGALAWVGLGTLQARRSGIPLPQGLAAEAALLSALWLRPALTAISLVALAVQPTYPYGFTLPVALTQDWGPAQDAAAVAALLAAHVSLLPRVPAPSVRDLGFLAFLAYALLTPSSARHWDGHPGNEPKTLRMAVALGHGLTLDVEGVSASMEALTPRPLGAALGDAARGLARESAAMVAAVGRGEAGRDAIRATRVTRQTVRGKDGGVYHVLAPGPSFLLAPLLRIDRALNLWRGTPGRLALTLLAWNALAAWLIAELFRLLRDATGRVGVPALVAAACALLPPFLFYSFQLYPEMPGALVLAVALRLLLFTPWRTSAVPWRLGLLLATLPWLHQKFLPVWGVLSLWAVAKAVGELVTFRGLLGILVPQAATLYLTALYNFGITGSVRPDALFLAWGPGGVASARLGQGLLGLLLDARYGILPYVPLYLLAAAGWATGGRLARALPVMAVYYVTVAAADNWSGAVCNLGRYVMPVVPWLVGLGVVALAAAAGRRGVQALALTLAAWSGLVAWLLWRDPHAANDCALLLARSTYADGNVYVPNLFLRTWADAAPGLWARVAAWIAMAVVLAAWMRRAARGRGGASPARALAGLALVVLGAAVILERWPSGRDRAHHRDGIEVTPGVTLFVSGAAIVEDGEARAASGDVDVLVRARSALDAVPLRFDGEGAVRLPGRPPFPVPPAGLDLAVPLAPPVLLEGRRGVTEALHRQRIRVESRHGLRITASGQRTIRR
jgi:hypothetical protein